MSEAEGETVISRHARVSGRIETPGSLRVDGRVEGMIRAADRVVVAPTGVAVSEIEARFVEIRGVVIGNVHAEIRIDVHEGARVVGDLVAPNVDLDAGATLEGRIDRGTPAAPPPEPVPALVAGTPEDDALLERTDRQTFKLKAPIRRPTRPPGEAAADRPRPAAPRLPRLGAKARLIPRKSGDPS